MCTKFVQPLMHGVKEGGPPLELRYIDDRMESTDMISNFLSNCFIVNKI